MPRAKAAAAAAEEEEIIPTDPEDELYEVDAALALMDRQMRQYHDRVSAAAGATGITFTHRIYRIAAADGVASKGRPPCIGMVDGTPPDEALIAQRYGAGTYRVISTGRGAMVAGKREEKIFNSPEIVIGEEFLQADPTPTAAPAANGRPVVGGRAGGLTLPVHLTGENSRMLETLAMFEALIMLNGRLTASNLPMLQLVQQSRPAAATPLESMLPMVQGIAKLLGGNSQTKAMAEIRAQLAALAGGAGAAAGEEDEDAGGGNENMLGGLLAAAAPALQPFLEKALSKFLGAPGAAAAAEAAGAVIPQLLADMTDAGRRQQLLGQLKKFTGGNETSAQELIEFLGTKMDTEAATV